MENVLREHDRHPDGRATACLVLSLGLGLLVACIDKPAAHHSSRTEARTPAAPREGHAPTPAADATEPPSAPPTPAENLVLKAASARVATLESELAAVPTVAPRKVPTLTVGAKPEDGLRKVQARLKVVRASARTLQKLADESPVKDEKLTAALGLMFQLFDELDRQCKASETFYYANNVEGGHRLGREAASILFQIEGMFPEIERRVADPGAQRRKELEGELARARAEVALARNEPLGAGSALRLADLESCTTIARLQPWGGTLSQIPATVIDKGVLRFVPYVSFKAGDHEVNVYGDPGSPAGIEVGIYGRLTGREDERQACIDFIAGALAQGEDRDALRQLNLDQDSTTRAGLTFEVTPPTAPDAYGGWWVSVYDEARLDLARTSGAELERMVEKKDAIKVFTNADIATASAPPSWTAADLPAARASGDRVYVKAYHRKDGTYVPAHTRSKPSR